MKSGTFTSCIILCIILRVFAIDHYLLSTNKREDWFPSSVLNFVEAGIRINSFTDNLENYLLWNGTNLHSHSFESDWSEFRDITIRLHPVIIITDIS